MTRGFNPSALLPIEGELIRERGSALARTGRQLEQQLGELSKLETLLSGLSGPSRAAVVARYQTLREDAEHTRWKMIVQREAMGLRRHDDLPHHYPIPAVIKE